MLEIHHVAGEDCFLLKVRAKDAEHLGQMLRCEIAAVLRRHVDAHHDRPRNRQGNRAHSIVRARIMKLAYLAWLVVCVVWGTTYLGIRVALESVPVALLAGLRWAAAGAILAVVVPLLGERLPPFRTWGSIALTGFLDGRHRQRRRRMGRAVRRRAVWPR